MAKYYMKEDNLTSMSDSIRTISGKSNKLSTNDIISNLKDATNEVNDQVDLIEKIGRKFFDIDAVKFIDGTIRTYHNSEATDIRSYAFSECNELESVNCPNVTGCIGMYAFDDCVKLESVDLPNVTELYGWTFINCKSLKYVNLPKYEGPRGNGFNFQNCISLESINLPSVKRLWQSDFSFCKKLKFIDLGSLISISDSSFSICYSLDTIILRSNTLCTLNNSNAFNYTPIESGTGYIYVPKALIEDYKVATNWSTYASQFRAIEDYPEICETGGNI